MDGTVEAVDSNAVATDTIYLVGGTEVTLTFSTKVTNINGADVSAYNGAQLSEDGKTLTLTAKNDGEPIVVNMTTTGKLPFSSLSKSDFTVSGTIEHQTVTCSKDGVGELSLVYVRTYDGAVFATYPAANDLYGLYKQRKRAISTQTARLISARWYANINRAAPTLRMTPRPKLQPITARCILTMPRCIPSSMSRRMAPRL